MKKSELLIVIPAYNEEKNISKTINSVRESLPDAEIVVISDGSIDDTASIAERYGSIVINHSINLGDGAARQSGFKYALQKGYQYVIQLDADGQHSPGDIHRILDELKNGSFDIIIGSRFLGNRHYNIPLLRYLGMKMFSTIASLSTGQLITDPTSGFRGINRKAMEFYVNHFYPEHYPDADVIIASHYAGLKIKEIPVMMYNRRQGKSLHSGLSPIYYIYKMSLSIFTAICYQYGGKDAN